MNSRLLFSIVGAAAIAVGCAQSDAGITASVKSRLANDDMVQARRIDVDTRNRVVTLTGEVRTSQEEARALEIARNTNGVTNVIDELMVVPETAPTTGAPPLEPGRPIEPGEVMTDTSITASVKTRLLVDPDTAGLRIDVDTKDGIVTLTGKVSSQAEKKEAVTIARQVEGVRSVTDRLTVERR